MRTLLALVAVLSPLAARADEPAQLEAAMREYFAGEAAAARPFMTVGIAAMFGGTVLAVQDQPRLFHASWATFGIGVVEAAAGITLELRTPIQVDDALARLQADPKQFREDELARVARIRTETTWLLWVEGILAVAGISMAIAGEVEDMEGLAGAGYSLALQSTLMLGFDIAVRERAHAYGLAIRGQF